MIDFFLIHNVFVVNENLNDDIDSTLLKIDQCANLTPKKKCFICLFFLSFRILIMLFN